MLFIARGGIGASGRSVAPDVGGGFPPGVLIRNGDFFAWALVLSFMWKKKQTARVALAAWGSPVGGGGGGGPGHHQEGEQRIFTSSQSEIRILGQIEIVVSGPLHNAGTEGFVDL